MSPRPRGAPPDRRRQILDAALRVFARRGYAAATNAEISREAGVTPAALYYYFPSKAELFRAALTERQAVLLPELNKLRELRDMPPEEVLPLVTRQVFRVFTDERTRALVRIMLAEGPREPELSEIWTAQLVDPVAARVLEYLAYQMDRGALRRLDPRVAQLMVAGPLMFLFIARDLLHLPYLRDLTDELVVRQLAEGLLYGLLAEKRPARAADCPGVGSSSGAGDGGSEGP